MKATIELRDEINTKIHGLTTRHKQDLQKKFSFMVPHAYFTPAYRLGRWSGKVHFFTFGGVTYINLLDEIIPILVEQGYELEVDDQREQWDFDLPKSIDADYFRDKIWPEGHEQAGEEIVLRDYQVEAINQFLSEPASIQELATGSGKTVLTAALSSLIEKSTFIPARTIVIVPNKDLVTQTEADYKNLGLNTGVYFGDRKEYDRQHTICTWQSLERLNKRYKDGESDLSLESFSQGVMGLIVDEVHGAKANVLKGLLTGPFANIPIRWGLTGTVPQNDIDSISLRISIGKMIGQLKASTLQEEGVLANCHVKIMQLEDQTISDSYQRELTELTSSKDRLDELASIIDAVSDSGNTLVLVHRIKAGEGLLGRLRHKDVVFVKGAMKGADRKHEYDGISTGDNKIIIATYGVASVGINVPRIFNMVMIEPGKSFIRVIQSIGRGLRKASDKDEVQIYDICSTAKFSKRHLRDRKKIYGEAEYPFSLKKYKWKGQEIDWRKVFEKSS